MISWLIGSNTKGDDVISNIFYYTVTNNNKQVIKLLDEHKMDLNNKEYRDEYSNTLLHILANGKNVSLAKHLILHGLRKDHENVFNEKAVDIALKNNNLEMVRILTDIVQDPQLLERVKALEVQNETLCDTIEQSEIDLEKVHEELEKAHEEIKSNKRKRCDNCDENVRECKRLKTDNDELTKVNKKLTKDNGELQTTVNNLRESFKK
jgi:ankyrin repeat protein